VLNRKNTVSQIMTRALSTEASQSVFDALHIMAKEAIGSVVVTQNTVPVGILTQRDIVKWLVRDRGLMDRKVGEVMSQPLVSVRPDATVIEAMNLMKEKDIRHLPIVSGQRMDGIVTIHRELLYWVLGAANGPRNPESSAKTRTKGRSHLRRGREPPLTGGSYGIPVRVVLQ